MRCLLVVLLFVIVGCKKEADVSVDNVSAAKDTIVVSQSLVEKPECDADFNDFIKKFKNDTIFQVNHVKFPLVNSYLDDNYDKVIRDDIAKDQFEIIDFSKHNELYKLDFKQHHDSLFYRYRGTNNGIYVVMKFAFENDCWCLVAIEDSST